MQEETYGDWLRKTAVENKPELEKTLRGLIQGRRLDMERVARQGLSSIDVPKAEMTGRELELRMLTVDIDGIGIVISQDWACYSWR